MRIHKTASLILLSITCALTAAAQTKPRLTLDEFFNSVDFTALEISPDGNSVVIATERADWDQQIFRSDLWLYHGDGKSGSATGNLIQLTQSGHDSEPQWSPDGRWIAFLSERKPSTGKGDSDSDADSKDDPPSQVYLISPNGGEAFPVTQGEEEVHAFAWSADSQTIYFATRQPWTKAQKDDYKKDWKDVVQYRTAERGDTIFALNVPAALARHVAAPARSEADSEVHKEKVHKETKEDEDLTSGALSVTTSPLRVDRLCISPDGRKLAFLTNAINQRQEKTEDVEIYVVDLRAPSPTQNFIASRRVTNNQAVEVNPRWANDSRHIFFSVEIGDVSGPYHDLQPHLYSVDTDTGKVEQWSKDFIGPIEHYAVARLNENDSVLTSARVGTEVQMYSVTKPSDSLHRLTAWPGTYSRISAAAHSPRVAFIHSSLDKPDEVYLADSADKLDQARPITQFNKLFTERDLPQGKPYQWKADDGTTIEGMLIYPPGKFESKHLPMLTFIHGGPADADGNRFGADWYDWATLAASQGWLVFRPNYRGSSGYGDDFMLQIAPHLVSKPGEDILAGVDALVKDGYADPDRLAIGGYSYGGYMTNWLITETTRFKVAVTGAGAVEHAANWGNDDVTWDDSWYLSGKPWETPEIYQSEAALFRMNRVKTPTHIVQGSSDVRVSYLEGVTLERALQQLGVDHSFLVFPGEGHSLTRNPWHGYIKLREELKWLDKYVDKYVSK